MGQVGLQGRWPDSQARVLSTLSAPWQRRENGSGSSVLRNKRGLNGALTVIHEVKVASLLLPEVFQILAGPEQDGPVQVGNETSVGAGTGGPSPSLMSLGKEMWTVLVVEMTSEGQASHFALIGLCQPVLKVGR